MTEWKYPGDEVVRKVFLANVLKIFQKKGLTCDEFERRMAEAERDINRGVHKRAFGRAIRKLRQERNMTRRELATSAGISVRLLIQVEHGHANPSVPQICKIAYGLKLRPHELMEHYENAVTQADSSQAGGSPYER